VSAATRTCSRCGHARPLSDFYALRTGVDGLMPYCKKCDNSRPRKPTALKVNRMRARHRAVADLIAFHQDEFDALLSIRLAEATEEAAALASTTAAKEHYRNEPVRLKPGKRMVGEKVSDRIDVARCPHCVKHHDRGHACEACGATPSNKIQASRPRPRPIPSGVRRVAGLDVAALDEFNAGTERARRAAR
jgi:hypothetical protein